MVTDPSVPMNDPSTGCDRCRQLAYTGSHEPYLIDDIPSHLRFWRCTNCRTLWCEREHDVVIIGDDEADTMLPAWRTTAAWTALPLAGLLAAHRTGAVNSDILETALLHHAVWVTNPPRQNRARGLPPLSSSALQSAPPSRRPGHRVPSTPCSCSSGYRTGLH